MRPAFTAMLFLAFSGLFFSSVRGQQLSWELVKTAGHFELEVSGFRADHASGEDLLRVFVGDLKEWPGKDRPSILGQEREEAGKWYFRPRFPFREEVVYTAFLGMTHRFVFQVPGSGPPARLTAIFPSTDIVPANLLKIYLHFSAPMGEGRAYEHLTLTRKGGDTVYQPFVPLQPELWSEDRQRLTLWLDPGRVKRGLLSHEAQGAVLQEGGSYVLNIDPGWKDAAGKPLGKNYEKLFRVQAPDYRQPSIDQWVVHPPKAGSLEALVVEFGEPLDHALASGYLQVINAAGLPVAGEVALKEQETEGWFSPDEPWEAGIYSIVVDSNLEDLSGNNFNRPFELDLDAEKAKHIADRDYCIQTFQVIPSE